jgi:hypothetical protein
VTAFSSPLAALAPAIGGVAATVDGGQRVAHQADRLADVLGLGDDADLQPLAVELDLLGQQPRDEFDVLAAWTSPPGRRCACSLM